MMGKAFLKGLAAVLPVAITAALLYWIAVTLEQVLGAPLRWTLPAGWYKPGMGLAVGLVLVIVIGVLLQVWLARAVHRWMDRLLERLPLVKSIYGSVKDLMSFFVGGKKSQTQKTVIVRVGEGDRQMRLLGFVMRETFDDVPAGVGEAGMVAVYLPMSYQIGGYTVIVRRDAVEPVDMTTEDALKFALTAGVKSDGEQDEA